MSSFQRQQEKIQECLRNILNLLQEQKVYLRLVEMHGYEAGDRFRNAEPDNKTMEDLLQ